MTFMQGVYNYIPESNHASMVYSVAAVLYLQSVLRVMLFRPWNMFCTFTLALSDVCVQYPIWFFFFCISVISWFPAILLWYGPSDLEMVPVALFLLVSLLLPHATCDEFLLWGICILQSYRLLSWSHFCIIIIIIIVQVIAVRVSSLFARFRCCWTPQSCTWPSLFNIHTILFPHISVDKIRSQYPPAPQLWRHRPGLAV